MKIKTLLLASLATSFLFSSELKINGIVLIPEGAAPEQYSEAKGVVIQDLLYADSLAEVLEKQFIDQPLTDESAEQIRESILNFYQSHDRPLVAVHIPEQEISNGAVVCVVLEAKAGNVSFCGNRWFPDRVFRKQVSIQPGDVIDEAKMLNAIAWLNHNPFHQTEVVISPNGQKGVTDLEIITKDRFPVRPITGVDNTGTEFTDEIRLYAGANWGNAFNVDDLLSMQFMTAPDPHRFISGFGSYTSFLPWQHTLSFFGAYARIHPKIENFTSSGTDIQGSARYAIPIKPLFSNYLHEFTFGFDFKTYNNALFFSEFSFTTVPVIFHKIDLSQIYLGYKLNDIFSNHDITLRVEVLISPGQIFPHQTHTAYENLRANAPPKYIYGKMAVGDIWTIAREFKIAWLLRGQLSSAPLLPSEQFALGGYDTVRGYNELDFPADNMVLGNLEIRTPYWHLNCKWEDRLLFLAFIDAGWGRNEKVTLQLPSSQTLVGTGVGIRYTVLPYLNGRLDYGFKLHDVFQDHRFGKFHFSVAASF